MSFRRARNLLKCPLLLPNRCYAMKSPVPIKWVRPVKIPSYKPQKSGDLSPLAQIDLTRVPIEFRDCEELKTANDAVKKLFTLEYFPYSKTVEVLRDDYYKSVNRHVTDTTSPEAKVAKMTADIRDMQKYIDQFPRDKRAIVRLKEAIDRRKRLLKLLRTWDYKCFEWLLEKMDLVYKPNPEFGKPRRVERKKSLRLLTKQYCDNIVQGKLNQLKSNFEAEQINFLQYKIDTLKWIMREEADCNVPPTVLEKDIEDVQKRLDNLKLSQAKTDKIDADS